MTDGEIHNIIARCGANTNTSWDDLITRFSKQMTQLAGRLTEEELYALLDIALACYQKGYDEISAGHEAESVFSQMQRLSRRPC